MLPYHKETSVRRVLRMEDERSESSFAGGVVDLEARVGADVHKPSLWLKRASLQDLNISTLHIESD